MNNVDSIGQDLVAMCVNDALCHGAIPIAFLDYYVTGQLNVERAARVVKSIASACIDCGCALVGKCIETFFVDKSTFVSTIFIVEPTCFCRR